MDFVEGFALFRPLCVVLQSSLLSFSPNRAFRVRPAIRAGTGRDPVSLVYACRSEVLMFDESFFVALLPMHKKTSL